MEIQQQACQDKVMEVMPAAHRNYRNNYVHNMQLQVFIFVSGFHVETRQNLKVPQRAKFREPASSPTTNAGIAETTVHKTLAAMMGYLLWL